MKIQVKVIALILFLFSAYIRIMGIGWDGQTHIHPDERFLSMVVNDIKLPKTLIEYLSTTTSPLNPYNHPSYKYFVYGTFPLTITKYLAHALSMDDYSQGYYVGRMLSASFDLLVIFCLYRLSRLLFYSHRSPYLFLLAPFIYAFAVLPVQLSHFFYYRYVSKRRYVCRIHLSCFCHIASSLVLFPTCWCLVWS